MQGCCCAGAMSAVEPAPWTAHRCSWSDAAVSCAHATDSPQQVQTRLPPGSLLDSSRRIDQAHVPPLDSFLEDYMRRAKEGWPVVLTGESLISACIPDVLQTASSQELLNQPIPCRLPPDTEHLRHLQGLSQPAFHMLPGRCRATRSVAAPSTEPGSM